MSTVLRKIESVLSSDKGALSVEYGLILSGVAALGILVVAQLSGTGASSVKSALSTVFTSTIAKIAL